MPEQNYEIIIDSPTKVRLEDLTPHQFPTSPPVYKVGDKATLYTYDRQPRIGNNYYLIREEVTILNVGTQMYSVRTQFRGNRVQINQVGHSSLKECGVRNWLVWLAPAGPPQPPMKEYLLFVYWTIEANGGANDFVAKVKGRSLDEARAKALEVLQSPPSHPNWDGRRNYSSCDTYQLVDAESFEIIEEGGCEDPWKDTIKKLIPPTEENSAFVETISAADSPVPEEEPLPLSTEVHILLHNSDWCLAGESWYHLDTRRVITLRNCGQDEVTIAEDDKSITVTQSEDWRKQIKDFIQG